ncbi:MAG: hypothetical protein ACP5E3_00645, partial [Bacteroidales bacterium]
MHNKLLFLFGGLSLTAALLAQPKPGDWFREYTWTLPQLEKNEKFLRVGGRFDYRLQTPQFEESQYKEGWIILPGNLDLKNALRAEVMVEKNLCHDYTTGLAISFNENEHIRFPEAGGIPAPQESYMHHTFPNVEIPLDHLKEGQENYFSLEVDSFQHWNWPQNLVYGLKLRVYYEVNQKDLPRVIYKGQNEQSQTLSFSVEYKDPDKIEKVDYLGYYEGPDMNGDGIFKEWHYGWFRGEMRYHIGSTSELPLDCTWKTEWIPDQKEDIKVAARVTFTENDLVYFTEAIEGVKLERVDAVHFCMPYNIPQQWITRNQEYSSLFYFDGETENIEEIKIVWRSWSPGYMNGLYLNDLLFFVREGGKYVYYDHEIVIDDPGIISILNKGINSIKTGKTPRYNWEMVHGMDVFYPGPMILI